MRGRHREAGQDNIIILGNANLHTDWDLNRPNSAWKMKWLGHTCMAPTILVCWGPNQLQCWTGMAPSMGAIMQGFFQALLRVGYPPLQKKIVVFWCFSRFWLGFFKGCMFFRGFKCFFKGFGCFFKGFGWVFQVTHLYPKILEKALP